jgi:altronate hydrolase
VFKAIAGRMAASARAEIWVIPTVGCVARTAQKIAERAAARHADSIDRCTPSPTRSAARKSATSGRHPQCSQRCPAINAGSVLIVGLGCDQSDEQAAARSRRRQHPDSWRAGRGDEIEEGSR